MQYPYELYSASTTEAAEPFRNVSTYSVHVWDLGVMRPTGNRSNKPSSKNKSKQDQTEAEGQSGDDMRIVVVPVTNRPM